jgi:hypothetical protein
MTTDRPLPPTNNMCGFPSFLLLSTMQIRDEGGIHLGQIKIKYVERPNPLPFRDQASFSFQLYEKRDTF